MNSTLSTSRAFPPTNVTFEDPIVGSLALTETQFNYGYDTELISVSWNQDYRCFATGTPLGFRIYNCEPFKETFRRDVNTGGFKIVEMLFRSNILALVGADANLQYPPNKVLIWDDLQNRCISEFSFRSEVRAVKLRRDRIVVVLDHKIYGYSFVDLKLLYQIETLANPRGLCCLSHLSNTFVLACPGLRRGQVRIQHFGLNVTKLVNAHDSHIACINLTMDGLLLATASVRGTLIRIFNTMDGTKLQEVRRGVDKAEIYSITLSPDVQWLAVSSDKGTVHIFSLKVRVAGEDSSSNLVPARASALLNQNSSTSLDALISKSNNANPSSSLSFMRGILPKYFSSEWSFAQFHVPEVTQYMTAFGSENTVIIIGMDGRSTDLLVQLVEERHGILAAAKSRQCCCCVFRKTEAQDHCKDLPSAIEEVRHKGTLLERVQRLENRVLQLSIEMGIGSTSRSSSSTSIRAAAPQNSEQGLDDSSNDVNPQEDKRCPEVETCVRNTQGNGERLFPRKKASRKLRYKKWVPWFQLGCSR